MTAPDSSPFSHLSFAARSDIGRKRKNNEDSFGSFPSCGVWCVADGMGGGDDGEVASAAVVKSIDAYLSALPVLTSGAYSGADVAKGISRAVGDASAWIFKRARKNDLKGCGSTFVGVVFDATAPGAALALHVGDSRLYRLSGRDFKQITKDHSVAEMMGAKSESDLNPMFRGMILRAVGIESSVDVEATPFSVKRGDYVLICSDGLTRMVPDKRIVEIIQEAGGDVETAVKRLIAAANEAGGVDNVTVELILAGDLPEPAAAVPMSDELASGSSSFTMRTLDMEMRRGPRLGRFVKPALIVFAACALALFGWIVSRSFVGGHDAPMPRHEVDMGSPEPQFEAPAAPDEPQPASSVEIPAPQADEAPEAAEAAPAPQSDAKEEAERLEAARQLKAERERREREEKAAAAADRERRQVAHDFAEVYARDDFSGFSNFVNRLLGRETSRELQKRGMDFYARRKDVDVCEVAAEYAKDIGKIAKMISGKCAASPARSSACGDLMRLCADVADGDPADLRTQKACIDLIVFIHQHMSRPDGAAR